VTRAIVWAFLKFACNTPITTSAVAFSSYTKSSVVAVTRAWRLNMANISLPALFAEALALKAIAVSRAVGNHLATLCSAIKPRPPFEALARKPLAKSVPRANGLTRAVWLRAINASSLSAEALSIQANSPATAVVRAASFRAIHTGHWEGANVNPLSGTVIWGILVRAVALALYTNSVSVAVARAVDQFTHDAMETLVTEASSIAADSVV